MMHNSKTGTYQISVSGAQSVDGPRAVVYRNGKVVTMTRGRTSAAAVKEAVRQVRLARHCASL